jgi:HisA/HisF family protein
LSRPRLIPVMDIKDGQVVHARGGDRTNYAPLPREWFPTTDPVAIAYHLATQWQARQLYVADLDAIMHRHFHLPLYQAIGQAIAPTELWLDPGVNVADDIARLERRSIHRIIVGTETAMGLSILTSPSVTRRDDLIVSIDLRGGQILGRPDRWGAKHPADVLGLLEQVVQVGIRRVIVLELDRVGSGQGPSTHALCRQLKQRYPAIELIAGGGVRNDVDMQWLGQAGVDAVLIGTALWEKTIHD